MELTDLSHQLATLVDPVTGNTHLEALRLLNEDLAPFGLLVVYTEQWKHFAIIPDQPTQNAHAALPHWPD